MRPISMIAAAAAACLVSTGCGDMLSDAASKGAKEQAVASEATEREKAIREGDAQAAEMLATKDEVAEARAWLADETKHKLWKVDRPTVVKLVDDLYAAGAASVDAAGIISEGDVQIAALFVVTLPREAAARAKVVEAHNAFWKDFLKDAEEDDLKDYQTRDAGQKHLVVNFDL